MNGKMELAKSVDTIANTRMIIMTISATLVTKRLANTPEEPRLAKILLSVMFVVNHMES